MTNKIAVGLILLGSQLAFANHSVSCKSDDVELWYTYFGDARNCDDNYYVMEVTVDGEEHTLAYNAPKESGYENNLDISVSSSDYASFFGKVDGDAFDFSMPAKFKDFAGKAKLAIGNHAELMSCTLNVRPYWGTGTRPIPENKVECVGDTK